MPPASWPITIRPGSKRGPAKFDPPTTPVRPGDVVSWNNETRGTHRLSAFNPIEDDWVLLPIGGDIAPGDQSDALTIPSRTPAGKNDDPLPL